MGLAHNSNNIQSIVKNAWATGNSVDLSGVGYGRIHWGNKSDIISTPYAYYFFLAGIVRISKARKIIEIGTHQGGSTDAMYKGFHDPSDSCLVTFDTTQFGVEKYHNHPHIRAYQLNANTQAAYDACREQFESVDLIYIDSTHLFWPTFLTIQIYSDFYPRLIVLDDITLNDEMVKLWDLIVNRYGQDNAVDVTQIVPEVRPAGNARPGFGLVRVSC